MKEIQHIVSALNRGTPEEPDTLSNLLHLSKMMVIQPDLNPLLSMILEEATRLVDAERSTLYLIHESTGELISYIAQKAEVKEIRLPIGHGIAGKVAETGETINLDDAYHYPDFDPTWDRRTGFRTRSVLCVPMITPHGKLIGVLQVLNCRGGTFQEADESALRLVASHAAIAIENARKQEDLRTVFLNGMRAMAQAVDRRDYAAAGHSERVTYYAVKIAEAMNMVPEEITALEYAATLHDIGKITVPDRILSKDSFLTDNEFEILKRHPLATREILEKFQFSGVNDQVPFIAGAHHEALDGSGYPDGLNRKDLPLPARILAVANQYDVLSAFDRPHRRAIARDAALALLKRDAGKKLDENVVETFIRKELYRIERRRFVRIGIESYVGYNILPRYQIEHEVCLGSGRSVDISGRGLLLISKDFIPVGTHLEVSVHVHGHMVELLGRVTRVQRIGQSSEFEIGITFTNLSEQAQQKLQDYLVEIAPL